MFNHSQRCWLMQYPSANTRCCPCALEADTDYVKGSKACLMALVQLTWVQAVGILFQNYFSQQYKCISASLCLVVISSYFSHHSPGLASPIWMVMWKEILTVLKYPLWFLLTFVGSSATQGGKLCTSGEYAKVVTKPPKHPHHFLYHSTSLCYVCCSFDLFSQGQENVYV